MYKDEQNQNVIISIKQAGTLLREAIPSTVTVMLWGPPGEGKTSLVNSVFEPDHYVWPISAGCSDPTDMGGIPDKMTGAPAFENFPPLWAFVASVDYPKWYENNPEHRMGLPVPGPLVLFFDDVVTADEQTQASLYKSIHERRTGRCLYRDDVRIIMAGNYMDNQSAANEMPMALGNRMLHLHVRNNGDDFVEWAVNNNLHPNIIGYIRYQPQHLNTFQEALNSGSKAFATPRSWHLLSDELKKAEKSKDLDPFIRFAAVAGMVGRGVATEYAAFERCSEGIISPTEILENPTTVAVPDPDKLDLMHATIAALETYVAQMPTIENLKAMMKYAIRVQVEFGALLARSMIRVTSSRLSYEDKLAMAVDKEIAESLEHWRKFIS